MYKLLSKIQERNPEKFNEDFIYLKSQDDPLHHIKNIFKALEVINGVEFIEATLERDESKFPKFIKNEKEIVNIEESRFVMINFKFRLFDNKTNEEKFVEKYLFFPKLLNNTFFLLNGSKFFPIFQIIDSATYTNSHSITLKSLLMPIVVRTRKIEEIYDMEDNVYSGNIKIIDLFKHKLNFLLYFFAEKGFKESMKFLIGEDWENKVTVCNKEDVDIDATLKDNRIFEIDDTSDTILVIDKKFMEEYDSLALNIIDILNEKSEAAINDKHFWIIELGKIFSRNKNNYESKALDILTSFKRILDNSTKETLRLKDENKEDIYAIIRWMTFNFDILVNRDNMDLTYKRIRIYEYLFYDLLIKMSNITYRLLNKPEITMKNREQLFSTLSPMFIIKKIGQNELLRYMGVVNDINLFQPSLKFSFRGFQGLGNGNRDVNKEYRGIHPSYIGKIGLTASSNGDPGMTGTFTPFIENKGFYFTDDMLDK